MSNSTLSISVHPINFDIAYAMIEV